MRLIYAAALTLAPLSVFAAGSETSTPEPKVTCEDGQVWNEDTETCEDPSESSQTDSFLLDSAQRYAHAGQYDDAQIVLSAVKDQSDSRTLTLWGFTHRKMGNVDLGLSFYDQALTKDPDNILARSYLGEAHVNLGDYDAALTQLAEIRARGGAGSRAETLLIKAMQGGTIYQG